MMSDWDDSMKQFAIKEGKTFQPGEVVVATSRTIWTQWSGYDNMCHR